MLTKVIQNHKVFGTGGRVIICDNHHNYTLAPLVEEQRQNYKCSPNLTFTHVVDNSPLVDSTDFNSLVLGLFSLLNNRKRETSFTIYVERSGKIYLSLPTTINSGDFSKKYRIDIKPIIAPRNQAITKNNLV